MLPRILFLLACLTMIAGEDDPLAKIKDTYGKHYVPVKLLEGSQNGAVDGMKVVTGLTGARWASKPTGANPKDKYAMLLSYAIAVKKDFWDLYISKGGDEAHLRALATEFVREYELKSIKLPMSEVKAYVDYRNELRNVFYETMNNHLAKTVGQSTAEANIEKIAFTRHTRKWSEVKPETMATLYQEIE